MDESLGFFALLAGIGVATGALTGLTGASGMSVLISGLLIAGVEIREVIGLTFVITLVNSVASVGPYWKHGNVDLRSALYVAVPAIAMVFLGHAFSGQVEPNYLTGVMILCLFALGLKFLSSPGEQKVSEAETNPSGDDAAQPSRVLLLLMGALAGFVMGIMGGGGAVFIGAALILLFKMPTKRAIGTSVFIMGLAAIPGVAAHLRSGTIAPHYATIILAASIPSAIFAGWFANRISASLVKRILGGYLTVISCVLLVRLFLP